ncbi:hypothetical protein ACES2J_08355 [Bdellovibrio bacteriovorus]|uniref:hypothetical protein n=1 Tax=Bdellovibrio bacteriovorus TaxID=959 RepID=UPI0035A64A40
MSKLTPKKLTVEDFGSQQSWIGKLFTPLNDFFSQVYQGWNNGITIEDNLHQEIRDVKIVVDANSFPMKIKAKFATYPKGVTVIYCVDAAGGAPTTAPWVSWSYSNGQIEISNITGLTVGKTYNLKIHVIYT